MHQIAMEEILNRATTQDKSLEDTLREYAGRGSMKYGPRGFTGTASPGGYYPGDTFRNGAVRQDELERLYRGPMAAALRGEDLSSETVGFPVTGNASGDVARNGIRVDPRTGRPRYNKYASLGGETLVQEDTPKMLKRLEDTRYPPRDADPGNPPLVQPNIRTLQQVAQAAGRPAVPPPAPSGSGPVPSMPAARTCCSPRRRLPGRTHP
jgi:hypothetical protein